MYHENQFFKRDIFIVTDPRVLRRRVIDTYTSSALQRLYTTLKMWILPLQDAADSPSKRGLILDVGGGFGYVPNCLSLDSPERTIIANDPAADRIEVARQPPGDRRNIQFVHSRFRRTAEWIEMTCPFVCRKPARG